MTEMGGARGEGRGDAGSRHPFITVIFNVVFHGRRGISLHSQETPGVSEKNHNEKQAPPGLRLSWRWGWGWGAPGLQPFPLLVEPASWRAPSLNQGLPLPARGFPPPGSLAFAHCEPP